MKSFKNTYNIAKIDNWESLKGYAGQELAFGRLMLCGFNVQRNLWRDAKYDGIFVVDDVPIRIEIKSSIKNSFAMVGGRRSGEQIDRSVKSRTKPISRKDADFGMCVSNIDATCWFLSVDLIEITKRTDWKEHYLEKFKETFKIFLTKGLKNITAKDIAQGFMKKGESELERICKDNNVKITNPNKVSNFEYPKDKIFGKDSRVRNKISVNYKSSLILDIWIFLYNRIKI
jgi:hypothetical protein